MNSCTGENLRVRLIGIKTPRHVIKTIHRCTILNANELHHLFSSDQLKKMFPGNSSIHFNLSSPGQIILRPEEEIVAYLDDVQMLASQHYPINKEGMRKIYIGGIELHMDVFRSHFPAEIIRKKRGSYGSGDD
jgi:hypothetical protein